MDSRIVLTVPEYYSKFIDNKVSLKETPKVCCPFHQENTPSFSYNISTGKWRCFGACKTGGDVIELHRMNYRLRSRSEAEESLCRLLGIPIIKSKNIIEQNEHIFISDDEIELDRVYHLCLINADTPERWIDMDYVMSIYPVDVVRLKELLSKWNVSFNNDTYKAVEY